MTYITYTSIEKKKTKKATRNKKEKTVTGLSRAIWITTRERRKGGPSLPGEQVETTKLSIAVAKTGSLLWQITTGRQVEKRKCRQQNIK